MQLVLLCTHNLEHHWKSGVGLKTMNDVKREESVVEKKIDFHASGHGHVNT